MMYLYIGYYTDLTIFDMILKNKINNMSAARQNLEKSLICGLFETLGAKNISFLSYVPTDGKVQIPSCSTYGNIKVDHIAINKKNVVSMIESKKIFEEYVIKLFQKTQDRDLMVIMYAINPIFESVLLRLKVKYNIKIVTICSEIPQMRRYNKSLSSKLKKKILSYYNQKFDGYIFLTEQMRKFIHNRNIKYIVLEGIAPMIMHEPAANKKNIIMYAGGLSRDNNIPLFLDYCRKIASIDEIWICGDGPDENLVKNMSKSDQRVKYFGRLNIDKVQMLEKQAKILVNLRSPNVELTKYSFPSKILEYISMGSLVLSTKLDGIPDEYYNHLIAVDLTDKDDFQKKVVKCLMMQPSEYRNKCLDAQIFLKEKKSILAQSAKIADFLKDL